MEKEILTSTFTRMHRRLAAMAFALLASKADVDDALQEAFYRLWPKRDDLRNDADAAGMTVATVRNICIDTLRRRASHQTERVGDYVVDSPMNDVEAENTDERAELLADVTSLIERTLSDRQRDILYKRERDGWEIEDIAGHYGLTEANVRMILSRARNTVREAYRNYNRK